MKQKTWYVYILASINRTLYIGITNNIQRRLCEHRTGTYGGMFSKKYKTQKLVYIETYTDVSLALAREKQLKRWRREKKVALIEISNPNWMDLAK